MPAATSPVKPKTVASTNPLNGMTPNCRSSPTRTPRGMISTRAKSPRLSVVPIPNMMIWMSGTMSRVSR